MKTDHTPGPWLKDVEKPKWELTSIAVYKGVEDEEMEVLAEVSNAGAFRGHGEANARLIAAAPKMLEALVAVKCGASNWLDMVVSAIREAIPDEN